MNLKNNQPMVLAIGVIAVVALVTLILKYPPTDIPLITSPANLPDNSISATTTPAKVPAPTTTGSTTLTYEQAVEKYADVRVQFNTACQPTPSRQTYKNGTTVMFDNRSAGKLNISVDDKAYTISAYGYVLVKLSATKLPHITIINCGAQKNVAQITLQQ